MAVKEPSAGELHAFIEERVKAHGSDEAGLVLNLLNDLQDRYRYIPVAALVEMAEMCNRTVEELRGIVDAFEDLTTEPVGEHMILVCDGTACHAAGSVDIIKALEDKLGIKCGETTPDGKFTLKSVFCVGACSLAPIIILDGSSFGHVRLARLDEALSTFKSENP